MSNVAFFVIAVIAVALLLVGGFVAAAKWLLWVGIILVLLVVISWLLRALSPRK